MNKGVFQRWKIQPSKLSVIRARLSPFVLKLTRVIWTKSWKVATVPHGVASPGACVRTCFKDNKCVCRVRGCVVDKGDRLSWVACPTRALYAWRPPACPSRPVALIGRPTSFQRRQASSTAFVLWAVKGLKHGRRHFGALALNLTVIMSRGVTGEFFRLSPWLRVLEFYHASYWQRCQIANTCWLRSVLQTWKIWTRRKIKKLFLSLEKSSKFCFVFGKLFTYSNVGECTRKFL